MNSGQHWIFLLPAMHQRAQISVANVLFSLGSQTAIERKQGLHCPDNFPRGGKLGEESVLARNIKSVWPPAVTPEQLQKIHAPFHPDHVTRAESEKLWSY